MTVSTPPDGFEWLKELCQKEEANILSFCRRQLRNEQDAEDAWQDTLVTAVLQREKLWACEPQQRGGWLTEAARHACHKQWRHRSRDSFRHRPAAGGQPPAAIDEQGAARWRQAESAAAIVPKFEAYWRLQDQRTEDARDTADKLRELAELVPHLPTTLRVAVELALAGHRPPEIAEQLGITRTAVDLRLHRARHQLGALLARRRGSGSTGDQDA